jgi:hypothetical protein
MNQIAALFLLLIVRWQDMGVFSISPSDEEARPRDQFQLIRVRKARLSFNY